MNIKLLALDMDGTTLREDCTISENTVHTIRMAIEKGITVVPTTGRVLSETTAYPDMIGNIPYLITSNGAAITDYQRKTLIYKHYIRFEKAMQILDILKDKDAFIQIYIDGIAYCDQKVMAHLNRYEPLQQYIDLIEQTTIPIKNLYDHYQKRQEDVEKIYIAFGNSELQENINKQLCTMTDLNITSSKSNNLEINLKTATKATGLMALCQLLNISSNEVMAIGDNHNDLHMLKYAGLSVAMDNSVEEVKAIADYLTLSNNKDGVAKAIEKFILA